MTLNLRTHLADWLRVLKLTEPELDLTIPIENQTKILLVAYPDFQLGIWEDPYESGEMKVGKWTLWGCGSDISVRKALAKIALRLGTVTESQIGPDLSQLYQLMEQRLWEAASDELNKVIGQIANDHALIPEIKRLRREINRAFRDDSPASAHGTSKMTEALPISRIVRDDCNRIKMADNPSHYFIGFFSQRNIELDGQVDAIWSAKVEPDGVKVWTGCAVGSNTQKLDSSVDIFPTQTELLNQSLHEIDDAIIVFVWDRALTLSSLKKWYFRAIGQVLPDAMSEKFVELRALALIAFPFAQRTDNPESLCKELNIRYQDDLGNGGTLASMEALLQVCIQKIKTAEPDLQTAWHTLLNNYIPKVWGQHIFPASSKDGFNGYLHRLEEVFKSLPEPVQASKGKIYPEGTTLKDFFMKPDGLLAQLAGDGYEERKSQMEFAEKVFACLQDTRPYVLEAGTGIGKTKGYLVPLLLNGKRAYVATHTKNLQDQAWYKDVPDVLKAFELAGIGRSVSILKGKNNYVCLQTIADWLEDSESVIRKHKDAFTLATILHWLFQTKTGWLSELGGIENRVIIALLGRDQAAPGLSEPWKDIDPHQRAIDAAQSVDIILANHSYIFARGKGDPDKDENIDAIIFDEAHNIENGVTEALTLDFKPWELRSEIAKLLDRTKNEKKISGPFRPLLEFEDLKNRPIIFNFAQALFNIETGIDGLCNLCCDRFAELRDERYAETNKDTYNEDPDYPLLFPNDQFWMPNLLESAKGLLANLRILESIGENLLEELPKLKSAPKRLYAFVNGFLHHVTENREALENVLDFAHQESVRWGEARIQVDEAGMPRLIDNAPIWEGALHSTPLDVSDWLREHLYPRYPHKGFVSATLAMGEKFDNILTRLGLSSQNVDKQPETHIFPSTFNYKEHVLLSVFTDSTYPTNTTDSLYLDSLTKSVADLARAGHGRTLALFTSRKTLQQVGLRLRAEIETSGIVPLMQTEGNRVALIERFRSAPKVGEELVLLGLRAFWEGVDVPGDPLSILVITRLPFDYLGHPVALARKEAFLKNNPLGDYFHDVVVPGTFLHLRQMYGRLIRKENDRGVCVFLDPRLVDKRYGRYLFDLLPLSQRISAPKDRNIEQITRFLEGQKVETEYIDDEPLASSVGLSLEQLSIVNAPDKRLLIRAAAGSGKTRVLIERIIQIVRNGKAPDLTKILALTYTVKAEKVMQERLEESLGSRAYELERNVVTYHKFATRIIRSDFQGTGKEILWVNEESPEELALFVWARSQSGLSTYDLSNEDARTVISFAQNGLVDEERLKASINGQNSFTSKLARFYLAYAEKLRADGLLDYGEAIIRAVTILRQDVDKRQKWINKYDWIFCDEYQDTTPAQSLMLSLIGQYANLFVVGDGAQSIYSWMGADPENLSQFSIDFPGTINSHLSTNYRCFPKLVRISNRFLERCGQKHGIRVDWDEKRSRETQNVHYLNNENDLDEASHIATLAQAALKLEIPGEPPRFGTVGVLARKWDLLRPIEIELIRRGIPYNFEGETARGLRKEPRIQRMIERALNLIAQEEKQQELGDTFDGKIIAQLRNSQTIYAKDLLEKVRILLNYTDIDTGAHSDYGNLRAALGGMPYKELVTIYGREEKKPKVILSTVHSQKGEEFDTVFVVGLENGNTPHKPPVRQEQILEWRKIVQSFSLASWQKEITDEALRNIFIHEEERIFYVAITRARFNLILCNSETRDRRKFTKSDFLEKATIAGAINQTMSAEEISLARLIFADEGISYRSEGRLYWTNSGIRVRSKSEAMLANEFSRRGVFFEYELPPDNITGVLPDFTLPDYGNVIVEHLGLLEDDDYRKRWEKKKKQYEGNGHLYLATNEQQIQDISITVDRVLEQARSWLFQKFGKERVVMIDQVENLRRSGKVIIGRSIGDPKRGIFEVQNDEQSFSLVIFSEDISDLNETIQNALKIPSGFSISILEKEINGIHLKEIKLT